MYLSAFAFTVTSLNVLPVCNILMFFDDNGHEAKGKVSRDGRDFAISTESKRFRLSFYLKYIQSRSEYDESYTGHVRTLDFEGENKLLFLSSQIS